MHVRWLVLCSLLAVSGCSEPGHVLLVQVKTDYVAGVEAVTARTVVRDASAAELASRDWPVSLVTDLIGGTRVAEVEGLSVGPHEVEVTLPD